MLDVDVAVRQAFDVMFKEVKKLAFFLKIWSNPTVWCDFIYFAS